MNAWIPCDEELPPDGCDVLCWISGEDGIGIYMAEFNQWEGQPFWYFLGIGEDHGLRVTHWRPLLEPPEGHFLVSLENRNEPQ